jgi:hypothetical protein
MTHPSYLLGDSLAVGMSSFAWDAGWTVMARRGAGLAWLRRQEPRPADRLILVLGTNDLLSLMDPAVAGEYTRTVCSLLGRWQPRQAIWATPGIFPRHPAMTLGAEQLLLAARRAVTVEGWRRWLSISDGRANRSGFPSHDGIHPASATTYRHWWDDLAMLIDTHAGAD